jgi:hypothetical protein
MLLVDTGRDRALGVATARVAQAGFATDVPDYVDLEDPRYVRVAAWLARRDQ